jgi:predicted 2-oxoglutarate/Fe(II)-dependent dioxygenase YbiX
MIRDDAARRMPFDLDCAIQTLGGQPEGRAKGRA